MAFEFKYNRTIKAAMAIMPGSAVGSSDIGTLVEMQGEKGILAFGTTADDQKFIGIVSVVPVDTTAGSNVPFYVSPITQGDVLQADYSTTVARAAADVVVTSNIGRYFGIGGTTTVGGKFIDPSICSTSPGTTNQCFFKMLGFSTQNDTMFGIIHSTHLAL